MTGELNELIDALRDELKQYGEMLALLDHQQELVVSRAPDELLRTVAAINTQSGVIQAARAQRERHLQELARAVALPAGVAFADLFRALPADYRPLLKALVDENNELLARVRQRARQNHLLLSRSMDLLQRLIATLVPMGRTTTYNETGGLLAPPLPSRILYEAVG
ncbi:MAG: flagellar protein FlgN [Verrucomicrobia bacterium]|nr:flagellar protein FlgN [Verrucomicrobiota bacterium]